MQVAKALWLYDLLAFSAAMVWAETPIELAGRRELFVDHYLIESLQGLRLQLHSPRDEGVAFRFDQPWEGPFCGYSTVLRDGDRWRLYYRGKASATADGSDEVSCLAESSDGKSWVRPSLRQVAFQGSDDNNIVLAAPQLAHNFSPMLDGNPASLPEHRYKALAGTQVSGLLALVSADGVHWKKLRNEPVLTKDRVAREIAGIDWVFDSQNVAFWSAVEEKYLAYFRVVHGKVRRIARAESDDFVTWGNLRLMEYLGPDATEVPLEHLYTNQTLPYFRAPQLYLSIAARFMPKRKVLSDDEAKKLGVNPRYYSDASDAILQTTRGGSVYDRTFLGAFIRPGIGAQNWVSRTNYPACGMVQTGPTELSIYLNQDYAQATAHLRRYSLRLDGFGSVRAEHEAGEMLTKTLLLAGGRLLLNYATSAAGGIRIEVQDENGRPIPGYALEDCMEMIGNEIERPVRWQGGEELSTLAGRRVRLRFSIKDADLFAIRFEDTKSAEEAIAVSDGEQGIERHLSIENVCAWPNLTKLTDGTMAAIIFGRPSHGMMEGDIECWTSRAGLSWEKLGRPAPNEPNTNRMNVAAGLDANGDLIVLCSGWSNEKHPNRPKQAAFRDDILPLWVCRSSDGGKTWTQSKKFAAPDEGWSEYIPFGDVFADQRGTLHVSCYAGKWVDPTVSTKISGYRSWHFQSEDNGATWRRTSIIGDKHNETTLLPLGGKGWLAAARIEAVEIFRSDDDGATWRSLGRATQRNEINGHLQRLKDGRILLTYGVRVKERFGVAAKWSHDEGKTWSQARTLVDDCVEADCGYPSTIERDDGSLVTCYYASGTPEHSGYHMGTLVWSWPAGR